MKHRRDESIKSNKKVTLVVIIIFNSRCFAKKIAIWEVAGSIDNIKRDRYCTLMVIHRDFVRDSYASS